MTSKWPLGLYKNNVILYSLVVAVCTTRRNNKILILPTKYIYVFCMDLRNKQRLFSQAVSSGFITEMECVYCAVRTEY
jgi:ribosomal protein S27E